MSTLCSASWRYDDINYGFKTDSFLLLNGVVNRNRSLSYFSLYTRQRSSHLYVLTVNMMDPHDRLVTAVMDHLFLSILRGEVFKGHDFKAQTHHIGSAV